MPTFALILLYALVALTSVTLAGKSSEEPLLRLGMVADNHYDTFPAGEQAPWEKTSHWLQGQVQRTTTTTKRRYDIAKDKMDEAIDVFNRADEMSAVINLGDLVNNDLMWNLKPILDSFNKAKAPHYNLLGNHDLRAHNDRFGKDNKTQHDWIRKKMGLGDKWYFSLEHPPFKLVFIDSMVMEPEQRDGNKITEHQNWLRGVLDKSKAQQQPVILFAHIPIGFETNRRLGPILKAYDNIIAAFFGHDHKGGYIKQSRTHCVTLQGQIETLQNSFAIVDFFADRIELTGFGRVPTRVMQLESDVAAKLREYSGPKKHDLAPQGNQPAPPEELWKNEVLQNYPPLNLDIPNYRKPQLPVTQPNPGETQFFNNEYRNWPVRSRTPAPEVCVDLTSYRKGKVTPYCKDEDKASQSKVDGDGVVKDSPHDSLPATRRVTSPLSPTSRPRTMVPPPMQKPVDPSLQVDTVFIPAAVLFLTIAVVWRVVFRGGSKRISRGASSPTV